MKQQQQQFQKQLLYPVDIFGYPSPKWGNFWRVLFPLGSTQRTKEPSATNVYFMLYACIQRSGLWTESMSLGLCRTYLFRLKRNVNHHQLQGSGMHRKTHGIARNSSRNKQFI